MASERTRNLIVGLTMLLALVVLMYGILLLGKVPSFLGAKPYTVTLDASDANGLTPGAKVNLQGVGVGQVNSIALAPQPNGTLGARILLSIEGPVNIPANATASIGKGVVGSSSYVAISTNGASTQMLPHDGTGHLEATSADNGLIPKTVFDDIHVLQEHLSTLAAQLQQVAVDMHALLAPRSPEALDRMNPNDPNRPPENISTMVGRLSDTIKSLQQVLGDPKLQGQVRAMIGNIADASNHLKTTLSKLDTTMDHADQTVTKFGGAATQASATLGTTQQQVLVISQKLVETLDQLQKTTRQISQGNGTTGKLINDPRLYEGLVDLSNSLKSTVNDLDFLLKKWKDEGVSLHF